MRPGRDSFSELSYGCTLTYLNLLADLNINMIAYAGAVITVIGLTVLGTPLVKPDNGGPVVAFAAGMGLIAALFTVFGTLVYVDFRILSGLVGGLVLLAGYFSFRREGLRTHLHLALIAVIAVSVLAVIVSGRIASEWDEFSHWLHAVRYLFENNRFPGPPDAAPIFSCCAAYPYGWPLLTYFPSMLLGFAESIPAVLNVLILGLFGCLLAQLAQPQERHPSIPLVALGVLGSTLLAPTFVSKLVFSTYADSITGVLVAVAAFLVYRINQALEESDTAAAQLCMALGLVSAALISTKPGNLVLLACVLGSGCVLLLRTGTWRKLRWHALLVIVVPGIVYVLWRLFVGDFLHGQELVIRGVDGWHISLLPGILWAMLVVAAHKSGYFLIMAVIAVLAIRGLIRMQTRIDRLAVIVGLLFIGYNVFLLFTYVAVFGKPDALRVASFWRYNTHLGLSGALVLFMVLGHVWDRYIAHRSWAAHRILIILPCVLLVIAPFAFLKSVRFDIDPMKQFIRETTRELPAHLPADARIGLYDPEGTGVSAVMGLYEWQGKLQFIGKISAFSGDKSLDAFINSSRPDYVLVLSGQREVSRLPDQPSAMLLSREENWAAIADFPYPGGVFPGRFP